MKDSIFRLTMRARTKVEVLVVMVLATWCSFTVATGGGNGADVERRDGDEGGGDGGGAQPKPHIVLIVADDLGWNDIPWHNSEVYAPNLESLARGGVILEQSYVQPICSPSRSALMSSRYPFTIGRQHDVIWPEMPTGLNLSLTLLPQALKAVGYETHAVGKWHLGFCSWDYTPTHRGFDTFYGYYTGSEDYYQHTRTTVFKSSDPMACNHLDCASPSESTDGDDADDANGAAYLDLRNNTDPDRNETGIYSSNLFASQVENLLVKREPHVPMFLYLPFQSVHSPLQVPEKYEKPYAHIQNHNRRTYLGMVTAMDEAVGRVVQALKATNHYNNTIIVFTTDNGGPTVSGSNNWPLRGNKTTIWEGGTRGSAFIHSPLLPNSGTTNPTLLHITDWLPTLVGIAGGEVPDGIDGVDQWGALTGTAPPRRTHLVYNIDNTTTFSAGVRMGKYKLLVGNPGPGEWTPPPEYFEESRGDADDGFEDATVEDDDDDDDDDVENEDNEIETEDDDDESEEEEEEHEEEEEREVIINTSYFEGAVNRLLQEMTGRNDTEIRLYDLESDPEEKHNLASSHSKVVAIMTHLLHQQLPRYIPADSPKKTPASNPHNFDDVWSPGWC